MDTSRGRPRLKMRFSGTVRNTTSQTVRDVRVEIHLSNGVELGPTPRVDLSAGETRPVELDARDQAWTGGPSTSSWGQVRARDGSVGQAATATTQAGETGGRGQTTGAPATPIRGM